MNEVCPVRLLGRDTVTEGEEVKAGVSYRDDRSLEGGRAVAKHKGDGAGRVEALVPVQEDVDTRRRGSEGKWARGRGRRKKKEERGKRKAVRATAPKQPIKKKEQTQSKERKRPVPERRQYPINQLSQAILH